MTIILTITTIVLLVVVSVAIYRQQTIVKQARASVIEQERMIETLRDDLATRDMTIADLQQEVGKSDSIILKLREQLSNFDTRQSTLENRIQQQESVITNLRGQIESSEKDSRQSKALFSTISTVAYDMVFVLDESGIIIALNNSADHFFGDQNPIGEPFTDVMSAPDLQDIVSRALNEEESLEEQFKLGRQYFRARTQLMQYNGNHTFIGVAVQDITQLVRLNRARRDMVANISHELSTPIANIRLIIDGLFHERSRPKRKASIQSLKAIASEAENLQWTVQELLDLSMIESGQAIMKLIEEPLSDIVNEAIERLREKLDRRNITVVKHIPQKMRVYCDRDHIRRVVINLLSNAIKWSPEDDNISISAARQGEDVVISVFDNGPGVPDDQRERIFERFYQVDTSRSQGEGSGLGLAICKHIVEAHGGRIWAEGNAQGGGGRFLFTLLSANVEVDDDVFMDRAQHDYPTPVNLRQEADEDYEIELYDEDDETADAMDDVDESLRESEQASSE